jgi:hypothetical protein
MVTSPQVSWLFFKAAHFERNNVTIICETVHSYVAGAQSSIGFQPVFTAAATYGASDIVTIKP